MYVDSNQMWEKCKDESGGKCPNVYKYKCRFECGDKCKDESGDKCWVEGSTKEKETGVEDNENINVQMVHLSLQ